jgi:hypothetical protein
MSAAAAAQRLVISTSTRYPAMSVCTGVGQSLSESNGHAVIELFEKDEETDEAPGLHAQLMSDSSPPTVPLVLQ